MILLLSILLPVVMMIIFIYFHYRGRNRAKLPPGPPGLPFIGNLHQFCTANNLHVYLWKLSNKYGPIMQMSIGSVPILVVSSAKIAKEVLKTQDMSFCSRPTLLGPKTLSYNCLDVTFSPYGEYWREVRKIEAVHLFSLKKTQSFRLIREDEVSRMIARISQQEGHVVNLSDVAMDLGCNLICRAAFGKRYDVEGVEMKRFGALLNEAQAMMASFFVSDYFPKLSWVDKLSGLLGRLDRTFMDLDRFYQELIDEHLDSERSKSGQEEDILDALINLKQQNSCTFDLTWDHVKALLMNIFVAGADTSASSTVWTMTALIKAPKVMKNVQQEIRNVIGKKGRVDEDDLDNFPYLKEVINESLRMYPPVPVLIPREITQECSLEGSQIRPKTIVYVNVWAIARDPQYWEDPHKFLQRDSLTKT